MWIARNKDGSLYLFTKKPTRVGSYGTWIWGNQNYCIRINDEKYSVKWEDEPVEVTLVPIMDESSTDAPKLLGPCAVCSNARCLNDKNSCKYSDIHLKDIENNIKPLDSDIAKYVEDNFNELIS